MKHAFAKRLTVTTTLGRVNEALQCTLGGPNFCTNKMQSAADSLQKEVSQLLSIKHIQVSKDLQGA